MKELKFVSITTVPCIDNGHVVILKLSEPIPLVRGSLRSFGDVLTLTDVTELHIHSDQGHGIYGVPSIEGFVQMLQTELDFHKSVNLINEFFIEEVKESGPTVVANAKR